VSSGKETQLTADGVKDFGYATDNAGWQSSDRAIVLWSPDSTKIATYQQDQRDGEIRRNQRDTQRNDRHDGRISFLADATGRLRGHR
jgi:hypothetical protein